MALTDNLVAYYKLEGNSNDSVGTNNGTDTSVFYSSSYGKIGQGALLNGSNIKINSAFGLTGSSNFTFACWVKIRSEISSGIFNFLEINFPTSNYCVVDYKYNSGTRMLGFSWGAGTSAVYNVSLGTTNWHFIVATKIGTVLTVYLDGVSVATGSSNTLGGSGANASYFGAGAGSVNLLNGYLDEISVYSRGISSTEVTQLYNSGNGFQYPFITKTMKVKISGTWKDATPYLRVGGVWKVATPFGKVGSVWK